MQSHIKILAVLQIIYGSLVVLGGLIALAIFGGIGAFVGMASGDPDALIAVPILGLIGGGIFLLTLILSLPGIIAGMGLLSYRPWARILTIILSVFRLLEFPFGTALGVYAMWVLFSSEATAIFTQDKRYAAPQPYMK